MAQDLVIGIDVGGQTAKCGVVDARGNIIAQTVISSLQKVESLIAKGDKKRAEYYNYYTGKKWGVAESYDLCINSSILGYEETEKIIAAFIKEKMKLI